MGDVVCARNGMKAVADKAMLNRQNLYKMLNEGGGATLRNFMSIINAIGLRLTPDGSGNGKHRESNFLFLKVAPQ